MSCGIPIEGCRLSLAVLLLEDTDYSYKVSLKAKTRFKSVARDSFWERKSRCMQKTEGSGRYVFGQVNWTCFKSPGMAKNTIENFRGDSGGSAASLLPPAPDDCFSSKAFLRQYE